MNDDFTLNMEDNEVSTVIPSVKNVAQLKENISTEDATMPKEYVEKLKALWEKDIKNSKFEW